MSVILQIGSIILPRVWSVGTETEDIDDLVEHTSVEFPVEYLQEKTVHITATEVALAAVKFNSISSYQNGRKAIPCPVNPPTY